MNKEQKKIVTELMGLVIKYNCDTFHCWLSFIGHVDYISLYYKTPSHSDPVYIVVSGEPTPKHVVKLIAAKCAHDELYAPENIEATQEADRLAKISELKKQIEELS